MTRVLSERSVAVNSSLFGPYIRTEFDVEADVWEGPDRPGATGRYVKNRSTVSHARGRWANCSLEWTQKHGLTKGMK
jgi:hypothetical protein